MKKKNLLLSAWAITTMVSCGTPTNPSSSLSSSIMDSINTADSHDADYEAKHEAYELYVAEAKANNETPMTPEETQAAKEEIASKKEETAAEKEKLRQTQSLKEAKFHKIMA